MSIFWIIALVIVLDLYILVEVLELLLDFMDDRKTKLFNIVEILVQLAILYMICYIYF